LTIIFLGVIQKDKNLRYIYYSFFKKYYIYYIVDIVEKNKLACYNIKTQNIYYL